MLHFTDFVVGHDDFDQISVHPKLHSNFYWLFHNEKRRKIRYFVLDTTRPRVLYVCQVTLIKKGDRFSPRLHFTIRNRERQNIISARIRLTDETRTLKASVLLDQCHENFWRLMSYLRGMADIDTPDQSFIMRPGSQQETIDAFLSLEPSLIQDVIKNAASGIFTAQDLNQVVARKEQLAEFDDVMTWTAQNEFYWQQFFHTNKWIFGYGLNYVILDVNGHPYVGGKNLEGKGSQTPDSFGITRGNVKFSVIVEIKTPDTSLLRDKEVRSGAWGISKELIDAIAQIQANVDQWNIERSRARQNLPLLEGTHTVTPKGILVIGKLNQFKDQAGKVVQTKALTFERFRRSMTNIEILTFDELYERARFIVEQDHP